MKKIVLVDGNNLLFRSFYATSLNNGLMRTKSGFPTNALYGFINMINKIITEECPEYMMVAFDVGKTFRHEKYKDYKAGRNETPSELLAQAPVCKEVLTYMGIKYLEHEGYEADDIIGTFANMIEQSNDYEGLIISSDKDLLQLISDKVHVKHLKSKDSILYTPEVFKSNYGIEPIKMIDLKALMGDASDNIKGVKGIGEVTALKLLRTYGSLDKIYENVGELSEVVKNKLVSDKQSAYDSYSLATIYKEVPLKEKIDDILIKEMDKQKLASLYNRLEFYSLLRKLDINNGNDTDKKNKPQIITSFKEINLDIESSIYIELDNINYHKAKIIGVGIYNKNVNYVYLGDNVDSEFVKLIPYLKYTYDYKKCYVSLYKMGLKLDKISFDTSLAAYLLNYNTESDIAVLANSLGYSIALKKEKDNLTPDELANRISDKAKFIYEIKDKFISDLKDNELENLYYNIEFPLTLVLAKMELEGVHINKDMLDEMRRDTLDKIEVEERAIYTLAGEEFNISSPKQVGDILFEKLGLPYAKKNKTGYSTDVSVLNKLKDYDIVGHILEYRTLTKLLYTYIDGLSELIMPDGKVHTIFTQTLTRTGRLSSIEPNLQNIPIKSEYGKVIRKAFYPEVGSLIMSSDYSQIELRVFTHFAKIDSLIKAFNDNIDIHRKTASDIFHVNESEVTSSQRRIAKAVNFGILYGISSFGLSEDIGISIKSAKEFIETYYDTYPGIKEFISEEVKKAYELGYVKTLLKRKRIIGELNSSNKMVRNMGERMVVNTLVQGSAADIIKMAMVEIDKQFTKENIKSKMLLQVHDELIFNVCADEQDKVKEIVTNVMEGVYKLNTPLKIDTSFGCNWYEAK